MQWLHGIMMKYKFYKKSEQGFEFTDHYLSHTIANIGLLSFTFPVSRHYKICMKHFKWWAIPCVWFKSAHFTNYTGLLF